MARISTSYFNQRSVNNILDQQALLSKIQEQIATGKRIIRPSDDPSGATRILRLTQSIEQNQQYQRNLEIAENRLSLEESVLDSVQNMLIRIRELAIQANNSTLTHTDRSAIAQEVNHRLDELLALANTKDANNEYLFSGYQATTEPFLLNPNGTYAYQGDQAQRFLQVSAGRQIADSDSGSHLFMDIVNGNGTFSVSDNPLNTGDGVIDPGQVINPAAWVEDTYTITFVTNANGNLGYNVVGAVSGQVIPPLPQNPVTNAPDFVDEAVIAFNGIQTRIQNPPAVGDTFTIAPSVREDMFATVRELATAMEGGNVAASDTHIFNAISHSILELDNAFNHVIETRTSVGGRLNSLDDQRDLNETFLLELETTLSATRDLDYTSAVTELQLRATSLEAAQASFNRIQGLSLFQFI